MPVKYIDEKTLKFLDNDAVKASGAPRAYGIRTLEQLVASSLTKDMKSFSVFTGKL
jgi:hypothetical protein